MSTSHRPALDGIRAIAVLGVLFYHLGYRWMGGGFLGVDVFFVLSGYLITGLLADERKRLGRIHFASFWARRARRLFPALLVLVIGVGLAVRYLAPYTEWAQRRQDLIWTLFYAANWHQIAAGQDYFSLWQAASPLRHMWSLAIEEQFYVVWPLVMALVLRHRLSWRAVALTAVGIALSAAILFATYETGAQSRAYYGSDSRAHELLAGALLALAVRLRPAFWKAPRLVIESIALVSGLFVLAAFIRLHDGSPIYYRGGALVLAVMVVGLIWAVEAWPMGLVAQVLSVGPVRWVGQISYGLYLWHWPVIVLMPNLLSV